MGMVEKWDLRLPGPLEPRDLRTLRTHAQSKFTATTISVWLFWQGMQDPDQGLLRLSQLMELSRRQWTLGELRSHRELNENSFSF